MSADIRHTQNFLHSKALVQALVKQASIPRGGTVLEIGAGKGIITAALAEQVGTDGRVIAVELDAALAERLTAQFSNSPQVEIRHADILRFDLSALPPDYAVFANVPFNITADVLDALFTQGHSPRRADLILQIDALISRSPYGDGETLKALMIKPRFDVRLTHTFSRTDFTPQPGVDTALFTFQQLDSPRVPDAQYALYKDFVALISKDRAGEGAWRKVFNKNQLDALAARGGLVLARGLKSQTFEAVLNAFAVFAQDKAKHGAVRGALAALRDEQARRERINEAGGHHRSKKRPR